MSTLFAPYQRNELPSRDNWLSTAQSSLKGVPIEKIARAAQRGGLPWDILSSAGEHGPLIHAPFTNRPGRTTPAQIYDLSPEHSLTHLRALNDILLQDLANGVAQIRLTTQSTLPVSNEAWAILLDGVFTDLVQITAPAVLAESLEAHLKRDTGKRDHPQPYPPIQVVESALGAQANRSSISGPSAALLHTACTADLGGSDAFELAALLAWASEAAVEGNTSALPIGVVLSVRSHTLGSICKIRAARRLWATLTNERFGQVLPLAIYTETARHELSRTDTWTNLLRLTAQTAAALIGGSDSHAVIRHDLRRAAPNAFGHRLARNIMHILQKECVLDAFEDPVAGSWAFEHHTNLLCKEAWGLFLSIEKQGGWGSYLASGKAHDLLKASREELIRAERHRQPGVLGVSAFPNSQEDADLQHHECPEALMTEPAIQEPPSSEPSHTLYLSDVFGYLQAHTQTNWPFKSAKGQPVYDLIQIGDLKDLSARISWTENALAAAGLYPGRLLSTPSLASLEETLQRSDEVWAPRGCPPSALAVLITSDDTLASEADRIEKITASFKETKYLLVAGRMPNGRTRASDTPARIDGTMNIKSDLYGVVSAACAACGVPC